MTTFVRNWSHLAKIWPFGSKKGQIRKYTLGYGDSAKVIPLATEIGLKKGPSLQVEHITSPLGQK